MSREASPGVLYNSLQMLNASQSDAGRPGQGGTSVGVRPPNHPRASLLEIVSLQSDSPGECSMLADTMQDSLRYNHVPVLSDYCPKHQGSHTLDQVFVLDQYVGDLKLSRGGGQFDSLVMDKSLSDVFHSHKP